MDCRRECRLQSPQLRHSDPSDFYRSPWFESDVPFLVYRCITAIFCLSFLILCWTVGYYSYYTIYLSTWAYHVLTLHFTLSCSVSSLYAYFKKKRNSGTENLVQDQPTIDDSDHLSPTKVVDGIRMKSRNEDARAQPNIYDRSRGSPTSAETEPLTVDCTRTVTMNTLETYDLSQLEEPSSTEIADDFYDLPWYLKFNWVVFNIAIADAFLITTAYNISKAENGKYGFFAINKHILNSVLALVDILICGFPVRFVHFVHLTVFHLIYGAFTIVYWALGGENGHGDHYIYWPFDYSGSPGLATGYFLGFVLILPQLFHGVVYGIYRFRLAVLTCMSRRQVAIVAESTARNEVLVDGAVLCA